MKGIRDTSTRHYRELIGNGSIYEVPKFQRDYSWNEEQWDDLWLDIFQLIEHKEQEHYMGYLVLQTDDTRHYYIVDGQQRFTTLSLLVLAVLQRLKELVETDIDAINNQLRIDTLRSTYIGSLDPVTLVPINKLLLNRNNNTYYRDYLVPLSDLRFGSKNTSQRKMRDCFLFFHKKIKAYYKTGEELSSFLNFFTDKLFFTVIMVTNDINAATVFETLNARGVQLSSADLLKNYLFSVVDRERPDTNDLNIMEEMWHVIIGTLGKKRIEDFLHYYWNSTHKTVRKNQLYKTIKKGIHTTKQVFDLLKALKENAELYVAIQEAEHELWSDQLYAEAKENILLLTLFGIKQANSLLMAGFINLTAPKFIKLLRIVTVLSFRYNVISSQNPNEQEEVYNRIALHINQNKDFEIRAFQTIYNATFIDSFTQKTFHKTAKNHQIVSYILSKIEAYRFGNHIDRREATIEHILPQNPADNQWEQFTNQQVDNFVYRLGNLTLLEKKYNKEVGNVDYDTKQPYFEKSNYLLTKEIAELYEEWNPKAIADRQKALAKAAKSIWQIQELENF